MDRKANGLAEKGKLTEARDLFVRATDIRASIVEAREQDNRKNNAVSRPSSSGFGHSNDLTVAVAATPDYSSSPKSDV